MRKWYGFPMWIDCIFSRLGSGTCRPQRELHQQQDEQASFSQCSSFHFLIFILFEFIEQRDCPAEVRDHDRSADDQPDVENLEDLLPRQA